MFVQPDDVLGDGKAKKEKKKRFSLSSLFGGKKDKACTLLSRPMIYDVIAQAPPEEPPAAAAPSGPPAIPDRSLKQAAAANAAKADAPDEPAVAPAANTAGDLAPSTGGDAAFDLDDESDSYDVELSGSVGTIQFINGRYCIQPGSVFNGRPTYKHVSVVPPGFSTLSGRPLFLYYHNLNRTWTIAMDVGSLEVIAFGVGDTDRPDHVQGQWFVSEAQEYRICPSIAVREAASGLRFF